MSEEKKGMHRHWRGLKDKKTTGGFCGGIQEALEKGGFNQKSGPYIARGSIQLLFYINQLRNEETVIFEDKYIVVRKEFFEKLKNCYNQVHHLLGVNKK